MTVFSTQYQEVIYKSRYARWLEDYKRRETWDETVLRLVDYYSFKTEGKLGDAFDRLYTAIYNLDVMPSMRALMTAGPALDRCNVAAYNCAYLPVDSPRSFDEAMYILLNGTGVGFSVESKYTNQLPRISEEFTESDTTIIVADSKEGWAKALREIISLLIAGQIPKWDLSKVRPAGSRLKTFGGRASGPEPLDDLLRFAVNLFRGAQGRRLTSIECHDLMCKIADVVVVGGVRRSAMISLFDCTDDRMNKAKHGAWWETASQRKLANNSAVYENRKPDIGFFMQKWLELYESKSGEPGLFSRYAAQRVASKNGRRDTSYDFGTNPCSEIILRPFQFCNLTEVIVKDTDSLETLKSKVEIATILGTIQASFTDFKYLRNIWKKNCEEEALLGVSFTGVCDNINLFTKENLEELKSLAIEVNADWAEKLGINPAAAITCIKPSGTVSQLTGTSSGLHTRHSHYYLRTIRGDNKDPLTLFLKESGIYWEPDVTDKENTSVFYFAVKSPEGSLCRENETALDTLERWKLLQRHWCEHKPSATIYVKEHEWIEVGAWVYNNFDELSGIAFLPYDGGTYKQAPYQELTEEEYNTWIRKHPTPILNWDVLMRYETEDHTTGSQEFACVGNSCEIG